MNRILPHIRAQGGFTLLEIVITLAVAAILGGMVVQFMGTSMIRSTEPPVKVQEGLSLNHVMESMTADYKKLMLTESDPLTLFKEIVENGNVVENDPYYGLYTPNTAFITFVGGIETPDTSGDNRILKVIITRGEQSLTALFTR